MTVHAKSIGKTALLVEWDNHEIQVGVSANLDKDLLLACLPLFEAAEIECIEWSFDTLFNHKHIPDWFVELLESFSAENRLLGHGVFFSLFRADWTVQQEHWLKHLNKVHNHFQFSHVTEHFGFMTGKNFHDGAPLSIPLNQLTLDIGRDRLMRIASAVNCPVGLENLAFAFSINEVEQQGSFLSELLQPVNGFLILDLHNIYCQAHNFKKDPKSLIHSYPLELVREIHVSGGSWQQAHFDKERQIRRDTHDDQVPAEVLELLGYTLPHCPNLKNVILEQLPTGLKSKSSKIQFRSDFKAVKSRVKAFTKTTQTKSFDLPNLALQTTPLSDKALLLQQQFITEQLESDQPIQQIKKALHTTLKETDWNVESWDDEMLYTAYSIAQKWK